MRVNWNRSGTLALRVFIAIVFLASSSIQFSNFLDVADAAGRVKRSVDDIPRPTELRMGLSQIQYKGYFERDSQWFSDARAESSAIQNSTTPSSGPAIIETTSTPTPISYSWTGYFIPDTTGEWYFRITADDAAFLWLGNDAVVNYQSNQSTPLLDASWPNKTTVTKGISLKKNKIYPLRIQYGNSGGPATFKLNYLAPGYPDWLNDFDTLLWRSPELVGDCTNFGLSYTLAAELGYDKSIPRACVTDGADKYNRSWIMVKPEIPTLVSTKITSTEFRIGVSLGEINVSSIYLTAPAIGFTTSSKLSGKISGDLATFTIPISKLKSLSKIDLSFYSTNKQGTTVSSKKSVPVLLPKQSPATNAKPEPTKTKVAPKSIRCSKGDKFRTFEGTACPPGWSK